MTRSTLQAIRDRAPEVRRLAAMRHVTDVRVFGSVAREEDGAASDVDFLVAGDDQFSLVDQAGLRLDLCMLLGRPVDVVTLGALRPAQRERIVRESVAL
jgi:predicted nucleotidyltransferase